jgi:hypothetical protein
MRETDNKRRSFLKQLLAGSAVAAGSALVGKKVSARETKPNKRPDEILYRKTDDFKKYYDSLR